MRLKVSKYRSIAFSILFLINALLLLVFVRLPWHCYTFVIFASFCYIVLGIFGFYGVFRENWLITCSHAITLILVVIVKVLGILALVIAIKRSSTLVETILRKLISKYYKDEWSRENMDNLQENGHCCGIVGLQDWKSSKIPESCCRDDTDYFVHQNSTISLLCEFYENGCQSYYEDRFAWLCVILIMVLVIKIILNVCAIFDGFYLVKKFRELSNKHVVMKTVDHP